MLAISLNWQLVEFKFSQILKHIDLNLSVSYRKMEEEREEDPALRQEYLEDHPSGCTVSS